MNTLAMTGLDGRPVEVKQHALEALAAKLEAPLLTPGDRGFDEATRIWNGMVTSRPAAVAQPVSAAEVSEAVGFARAHGLLLSIKGGGHNVGGTSLADGGLTLDMSRLRWVEVDPRRSVAHVGPGCLLGDVDRASCEHGLAAPLGLISLTGVAGLTLGGGFGYLSRQFGWTVDNLEGVEIVTADGHIRRAAHDEHDDLYWAVRGGGGNFGAVTRFTFRLHEIGPLVTGGMVVWDAGELERVATLYRELTETAPRELTLVLLAQLAPATPLIPAAWHDQPVVSVIACHTGDEKTAEQSLAPLRGLGTPLLDTITRKPYADHQRTFDASQVDGLHQYWKSEFVPELSQGLLDTFLQQAAALTSPMCQLWLIHLGGAVADAEDHATAFAHRDAEYIAMVDCAWPPEEPDGPHRREWARSAWRAMQPFSTGGNYVNMQASDDDDQRLRQAYGSNLDRLAQVKRSYDPDNLFRVNRNIGPA